MFRDLPGDWLPGRYRAAIKDGEIPLTDSHLDSVKPGGERSFGVLFAAVFAVFGLWPLTTGGNLRWWALAVSAVFLVLALVWPASLRRANILWLRFGAILGNIVAPVVMALVFFLVVTPLAVVARLLGKDFLLLQRDPDAGSYWISRGGEDAQTGSMKDQF